MLVSEWSLLSVFSVEISGFVDCAVLYIISHLKNIFRHVVIIVATFVACNFSKISFSLQI